MDRIPQTITRIAPTDSTPQTYLVVKILPKSHPSPFTWALLRAKQKDLRLHALLASPSAFSSTFAAESALPDAAWDARLRNPHAHTLVAYTHTHSAAPPRAVLAADNLDRALRAAWLGSAVLVGPTAQEAARGGAALVTYELAGVFVTPEARGRGLGRALVRAAARLAQSLANRGDFGRVRVRVRVRGENEAAWGLYESEGFVEEEEEEEVEVEEEEEEGSEDVWVLGKVLDAKA